MAYCEPADLLVGDMPVSEPRAQAFIAAAAEEMDMRLGTVYTVPFQGLLPAAEIALKRVNVLIATGRLVMAQSVATEDYSPNAYGTYLMREGRDLLEGMVNATVLLPGAEPLPGAGSFRGPTVINEDTVSAVDAFYGFAMRGESTEYRPGV